MRLTVVLAAFALLAGCATPTLQGRAALSGGRYDEAARHFEEALAESPGRTPSLVGLGIARYKLGALDEAQRALEEAAAQEPGNPTPQLYLILVALRRGDDAAADTHLGRYLQIGAPARLAGQLERTREALQGPVTPELRAYMAAGLEDAYQWAGEVTSALQAANDAYLRFLAADRIYLLPRSCRCR
jgi:tetratricopeptide (TPR) repeat protein